MDIEIETIEDEVGKMKMDECENEKTKIKYMNKFKSTRKMINDANRMNE